MPFQDTEVYTLDLSTSHSNHQVTPTWQEITDVKILETDCEFRVEVMGGTGKQWIALTNDECGASVTVATIVVKGNKEHA